MAALSENVRYIKGVGEKKAQLLGKLGIYSLYDLISYFPRSWQDRSGIKPIAQLQDGDQVCVRGLIATEPRFGPGYGSGRNVQFRIADDSGYLSIIYFHNPYVVQKLHKGDEVTFFGRVNLGRYGLQMANPEFENTGGIMPVYPLTEGLNQKALSHMIQSGLQVCLESLEDPLPAQLRAAYKLCHVRFAYENIHFPRDFEALAQARRRLVFEEFFVFSAALALLKTRRGAYPGKYVSVPDIAGFYKQLPFSLTSAQQRCIQEILGDMASGRPMNRLIQGDVGSGKTMCAAAAAWAACAAGYQTAFMAPTEILAEQHFLSLSPLFSSVGLQTALLTGSMTKSQKEEVFQALASGRIDLVIGTHALLSGPVTFQNLGLVIADEQHRFGVEQRAGLADKGHFPHMLIMSATPIPRTLALMLYGDLDVSILDELPPGRQPVDTFAVGENMRQRIYRFIRKQVEAGHQVYIVCPKVEQGEAEDGAGKAAAQYARDLQTHVFPDLHIDFVHGRMKAAEKERAMEEFRAGKTQILVATTVIEVGVDVPNATLIVIENADRFGLSQLHQLRGRVGRGGEKSYCILVSGENEENARKRLSVMCRTNSGFEIAEEDLKLRGPGDFFGARQHGLPALKLADLSCDMQQLKEAQQAAYTLLQHSPGLQEPEYAPLLHKIHSMFSREVFN